MVAESSAAWLPATRLPIPTVAPPDAGSHLPTPALASSGTYSDDGVGCTPCPTGQAYGSVGATAESLCTDCNAGSYAQGGNSDCLLCPAGTYQNDLAQGSCKVW